MYMMIPISYGHLQITKPRRVDSAVLVCQYGGIITVEEVAASHNVKVIIILVGQMNLQIIMLLK